MHKTCQCAANSAPISEKTDIFAKKYDFLTLKMCNFAKFVKFELCTRSF